VTLTPLAIVLVVAGTIDPAQLRHALPSLATWKLVALGYVAFSCGQAAFPSSGDRIGSLGALAGGRRGQPVGAPAPVGLVTGMSGIWIPLAEAWETTCPPSC